MPKLKDEVIAFFDKAEVTIEADLEAGWVELKPAIIAIDKTLLAQIGQAAITVVMNPTTVGFTEALASIVAQLPSDAKILQTAVAGALAAHIAAKMAAPAPTPPAAS